MLRAAEELDFERALRDRVMQLQVQRERRRGSTSGVAPSQERRFKAKSAGLRGKRGPKLQ